jgi:hypothetical protein
VPSARPIAEVATWGKAWQDRGYKVALVRDVVDPEWQPDYTIFSTPTWGKYPGYAVSTNELVKCILREYPECMWCLAGGDDVYPDPDHTADEIARECGTYFGNLHDTPGFIPSTFGVMQPTGHRYGEHPNHPDPRLRSAYIDRICGSPFMGRSFCERMNKGQGPFHPGFLHMHGDECLFEVAKKLGVLWQRRDLTHEHRHWGLKGNRSDMPQFLERWNTPEHWRESKALLDRLKAEDFAECMPI